MHYTCPHCHTTNRLPKHYTQDGKCGRCKAPLFTGQPIALDEESFAHFVQKNDMPVVVDFWASWCGPCQMMAPVFTQLASQMQNQLRFAKVNTEEAQNLSARLGIRSIPTLILFDHGREIDRLSGALPAPQLQAWLQQGLRKVGR